MPSIDGIVLIASAMRWAKVGTASAQVAIGLSLATVFLTTVALATVALAQDGPIKPVAEEYNREWFVDRAEQDAFMGALKQAAAGNPEMHGSVMLIHDMITGQPLGATGQRFGVMSSELGLLANDDFRSELDISATQYAELQKRQTEWMEELRRDLSAADRSDLGAWLRDMQQRQQAAQVSLESILLPHQQRRLQQALWEQQLRRRSLATLLSEAPLKETLEVTDRQATAMLELEAKLEEEIAAEVARLRIAARRKVLGELSRDQQAQAERLLGPALESMPVEKPLQKRSEKRPVEEQTRTEGENRDRASRGTR